MTESELLTVIGASGAAVVAALAGAVTVLYRHVRRQEAAVLRQETLLVEVVRENTDALRALAEKSDAIQRLLDLIARRIR